MARTNLKRAATLRTHEGAPAKTISYEAQLSRAVLSTMLWEDSFYESGMDIAKRIAFLADKVSPEKACEVAILARSKANLRHVPLFIAATLAKGTKAQRLAVRSLVPQVVQRADELAELLSLYWKDGKKPLASGLKKGLAAAFGKFDEYQFAKYDRDQPIKLRDVMFLTHPKPTDAGLFARIAERTLKTPDTWETSLSKGKGKKTEEQKGTEWERLIVEKRLGGMAILRNLRNMEQAKVSRELIQQAIKQGDYRRVLPFRFIMAANLNPQFEPTLEKVFLDRFKQIDQITGHTAILVDVSGSMYGVKLSAKSEVTREMAGFGIAMILREMCEDARVWSFSDYAKEVPARHGFALAEALHKSQSHSGTELGGAVRAAYAHKPDRIVVITDEQSRSPVPDPYNLGYVINVSAEKNGVGYGKWNHIDGFSAAVCDWLYEFEKL